MDEKSKEILAKLIDALPVMPDNKKDYILGFAEGVAAGKKQSDKPA